VKSFSKLTEDQKKQLIEEAFAAKKQLEDELEKTKKEMEKKSKQLDRLQEQVKPHTSQRQTHSSVNPQRLTAKGTEHAMVIVLLRNTGTLSHRIL
jgi:phage shock protein A